MHYYRKQSRKPQLKAKSSDSPLKEAIYPKTDYHNEATNQKVPSQQPPQHTINVPGKPQEDDKTRTERIIERVKRNPVVLVITTFVLIVGAVTALLSNINTLEITLHNWFPSPATPMAVQLPPLGTTFCAYQGHKGEVSSVAWSPNGRYIASAGKDGTVQIWDARTCKNITTYRGHKGSVNSISWSPDSNRIVSGGDNTTIQVWLADTGILLYTYNGCSENSCGACVLPPSTFKQVSSIAWSPDGGHIAFGSLNGQIRIFEADNGVCIFALDGQQPVRSVVWSADSKHMIFGGNTPGNGQNAVIQTWDANSNSIVSTHKILGGIYYMGISPDDKFIIATGYDEGLDYIQMWNISGNYAPSTSIWNNFSQEEYWGSIAWACDSKHAIIGAGFGKVEVFDTTNGRLIYTYHATPVTAVALSPDGTRVASADIDGMIRVWQASDKKLC